MDTTLNLLIFMRLQMRDQIEMMEEFHRAFGHPVNQPELLTGERGNLLADYSSNLKFIQLREKLHSEECDELRLEMWECFSSGKITPNLLKEGADLLYVVFGTFVSLGLGDQLIEAFKRVHESNMSKLENGKPIYREDGKVLKGKDYKPPNLDDLVGSLFS
jgi:predicted HAD superfamily Cof-like phosphohydrolase